jgi:hypothetical protein
VALCVAMSKWKQQSNSWCADHSDGWRSNKRWTQPAAEAGGNGQQRPKGSRGPRNREEWECSKCGTANFQDRQRCRINTCKEWWSKECKILRTSSQDSPRSPRERSHRSRSFTPERNNSPSSLREEDTNRGDAKLKAKEAEPTQEAERVSSPSSSAEEEAAEDFKFFREAKLQAEAMETCLENAVAACFPTDIVSLLTSEAKKQRKKAEEARPFESCLQKADARIATCERQVLWAESRSAQAEAAVKVAEEKLQKAKQMVDETQSHHGELWIKLKQQYMDKGAVVVSAIETAPKGVVGHDYAELARLAAELREELQKQEARTDPKKQVSLVGVKELMQKAVVIRRDIDAAKLRQGRRETAKTKAKELPPPAPKASVKAESTSAPSAPKSSVKDENTPVSFLRAGVSEEASEKPNEKRPRVESDAGSSSCSSYSSAPAARHQEKRRTC